MMTMGTRTVWPSVPAESRTFSRNGRTSTIPVEPLVKLLRASAKVGFEVSPNEPPYHGVRGQGTVTLHDEGAEEILESVIDRYLADSNNDLAKWLLSRKEEEVLIELQPQRFFSWDYRNRMEPVSSD